MGGATGLSGAGNETGSVPQLCETFEGYELRASTRKTRDGRWSVAVTVSRNIEGMLRSERFVDTKISLILKIEAEKESINFGRNLIRNRLVGF
jgi:hypothetical protein